MSEPKVQRHLVADGETKSVFGVNGPFTVGLFPGGSATLTCKVRVHPDDELVDLDPDTASYSANAVKVGLGPVAEIQVAAAGADGNFSVASPQ